MFSEEYDAIVNTLKIMGIRKEFNDIFKDELRKLLPEDMISGF